MEASGIAGAAEARAACMASDAHTVRPWLTTLCDPKGRSSNDTTSFTKFSISGLYVAYHPATADDTAVVAVVDGGVVAVVNESVVDVVDGDEGSGGREVCVEPSEVVGMGRFVDVDLGVEGFDEDGEVT
jgi:hypothetical protein